MAKIYGNIGSFVELVKKMNGIYSPASLAEVTAFKNDFSKAPLRIRENAKERVLEEISNLKKELEELSADYDEKLNRREELLIGEKNNLEQRINIYSARANNVIIRLYYFLKLRPLLKRKKLLDDHFEEERKRPFMDLENKILSIKESVSYGEVNLEKLIEEIVQSKIEKLNNIRSLLLKNNKLYEGAIGEQKVLDELKKFPDSFSVINNFQRRFEKGIYQKKTNDWIYSVQIDHILIGPTGIFLIETKNWSQDSIENKSLFSPVKQVNRARHALYCYLNNAIENGYLSSFNYNWGLGQISPKGIIVTINNTLRQEFQYVKILSLGNLFQYITSFESIFSKNQVDELTRFLSIDNNRF